MPSRDRPLSPEEARRLAAAISRWRGTATHESFAALTLVGSKTIGRLEKGDKESVSWSTLKKISIGVGLDQDALASHLDGSPLPEAARYASDINDQVAALRHEVDDLRSVVTRLAEQLGSLQ